MSAELIEHDPLTGLQTFLEFDEVNPRKFHIHHRQDVEPIIERNKELQKHPDYKKDGIRNGMQHVASIPEIWVHWLRLHKGIDVFKKDDWPKLRALLMDPEHKYLRPTLGDI